MKVWGHVQYVSTRIPQLDTELDRIEALLVAEVARQVHAAGERFHGWPTVTRSWLNLQEKTLRPRDPEATYVRLQLDVMAEER